MTIDSPQRQLQDACTALDRALRSGHDARVETWLEACPALASDDDLAIELIYSEYVTREALGPVPQADEYYQRFPNWADRLHRLFEVDNLLKPACCLSRKCYRTSIAISTRRHRHFGWIKRDAWTNRSRSQGAFECAIPGAPGMAHSNACH